MHWEHTVFPQSIQVCSFPGRPQILQIPITSIHTSKILRCLIWNVEFFNNQFSSSCISFFSPLIILVVLMDFGYFLFIYINGALRYRLRKDCVVIRIYSYRFPPQTIIFRITSSRNHFNDINIITVSFSSRGTGTPLRNTITIQDWYEETLTALHTLNPRRHLKSVLWHRGKDFNIHFHFLPHKVLLSLPYFVKSTRCSSINLLSRIFCFFSPFLSRLLLSSFDIFLPRICSIFPNLCILTF